jgi:hypothetical protein
MTDKRTWGDMFAKQAPDAPESPSIKEEAQDDFDLLPGVDPKLYRAFIVQRGRSRQGLFLDFRSFDERSGALKGTMLSYPQLVAIDYVDDHTILLDFGMRHVRIEGEQLAELIARLHTGQVSVLQAYSEKIWGPKPPLGPFIRSITHLGLGQGH